MERIAFIIGDVFLYWSSILLALTVLGTVFAFLALYLKKSGNGNAAAICVPVAMIVSMVLARLVHWYCRADSYASLQAALTDFRRGGFALMGVFAGCFLTALVLRILRISRNLPEMLDCMALAGSAGIAVGRLASFFNASGRGMLVNGVTSLPWVYPVVNAVSGQAEYRLATFLFQAVITAVISLCLLAAWLRGQRKGTWKDGDGCLIFLLCHGAAQVVLDSTRYDSLFFRSNGFVSIVQVLSAVAIGVTCIVFSVRLAKKRGWRKWYPALWLLMAALMGISGYMEYYVQRHGAEAVFAYSVMSAGLILLVTVGLTVRVLAGRQRVRDIYRHG